MTISYPESEKSEGKEGLPVMPCHPTADGCVTEPLVRGAAPSTPNGIVYSKRKEQRRMSIKKFFRCTPEQDAVIKTNAANAGMEEASYIRSQAIGKPVMKKIRPIRADWKELQRCMGVINKAGNVVNQLVKVLYLGGVKSDIADGALTDLRKAARAVMTALGKE